MTFSKKWENYWYHYKWHTIAVIVAVLLILLFLHSCATKTTPDLYMVYLSNSMVKENDISRLEVNIGDDIGLEDTDGDGKKVVYFEHLVSTFEVDSYVDPATAQKIQTVMYGGQHTLMLVHKYALEDYDGSFENLTDRVKDGDKTFKSPSEGFVSGISVEGNEYLESYGINTKDLYVALRRRTDKNIEKGKEKEAFDQAYKAMEYILSRQR